MDKMDSCNSQELNFLHTLTPGSELYFGKLMVNHYKIERSECPMSLLEITNKVYIGFIFRLNYGSLCCDDANKIFTSFSLSPTNVLDNPLYKKLYKIINIREYRGVGSPPIRYLEQNNTKQSFFTEMLVLLKQPLEAVDASDKQIKKIVDLFVIELQLTKPDTTKQGVIKIFNYFEVGFDSEWFANDGKISLRGLKNLYYIILAYKHSMLSVVTLPIYVVSQVTASIQFGSELSDTYKNLLGSLPESKVLTAGIYKAIILNDSKRLIDGVII